MNLFFQHKEFQKPSFLLFTHVRLYIHFYDYMLLSTYSCFLDKYYHAQMTSFLDWMQGHLLEHAFDTILEAGEMPPPLFFTERLFLAVVQHDYDKVTAIINAMIHTSFRVSEQQWTEVLAAYSDRITTASLNQLLEAICGHDLTREATIYNLYRTLQSMNGGGGCAVQLT